MDREERMLAALPLSARLNFDQVGLVERDEEMVVLGDCLSRLLDNDESRATTTTTTKRNVDNRREKKEEMERHKKEVVFVSGESGTGKSSLTTVALKDAIVSKHGGIFVTGKCDLKLRHQPLACVCQAFGQICDDLMNVRDPMLQSELRQRLRGKIDFCLLELLGKMVPSFASFLVPDKEGESPLSVASVSKRRQSWTLDDRSKSSASAGSVRSNTTLDETTNPFYKELGGFLWKSHRRRVLETNSPKLDLVRFRPSGTGRIRRDMDAASTKHLLQFVFKSFLRIVTSTMGTLVMVLDDLQWTETESMEMLTSIVNDPAVTNVMLVMIYRSNEVNADSPVAKARNELQNIAESQNSGAPFNLTKLHVDNLSVAGVTEMIVKLMSLSDHEKAISLSNIIHKRTLGNAYFIQVYLTKLQNDNLICFDTKSWQWTWDISTVKNETMATLNVVELLRSKMVMFPQQWLLLLQMASCLGPVFEKSTLILLCEHMNYEKISEIVNVSIAVNDVDEILYNAEQEMFIEALGEGYSYRFVHDKVQEAVMDFISEDKFDTFRSSVGDCLFRFLDEDELDNMISVVVDLLRANQQSGVEIATLNLKAAERAKMCSAFSSAVSFVDSGLLSLSADSAWETVPILLVRLHSIGAESEQYTGNTHRAEWHIQEVCRQRNVPVIEKMKVINVLVERLYSDGKYEELWQLCLDILGELGVTLPRSRPLQHIKARIALREAKSFYLSMATNVEKLRPVEDAGKAEAIGFMVRAASFALASKNKPLYILLCCKCVQWTSKFGFTEHTASMLASFANVIMHENGDWQAAINIAELAISVEDLLGLSYTKASTMQKTTSFVLGWVKPLRNIRAKYVEAYKLGMLSGNLEASGMATLFLLVSQFFSAEVTLIGLEKDLRSYIDQLERCKLHTYALGLRVLLQKVLNLKGGEHNNNTCALEGTAMQGLEIQRHPFIFNTIGKHHICNLCAYFSEYERGAEIALSMDNQFYETWAGASYFGFEPFSRALCLYAMAIKTTQKKYLRAARKAREVISRWAKLGALNLVHQGLILNAEEAVVRRNIKRAKHLYRHGIAASFRGGFLQDAGIANERYALFLLEHDAMDNTKHYMQEAVRCYDEWGAARKVQVLTSTYGWMLEA
jgi:predicted ATPase